jgi:sporulation protein YlmC with PRC-barrel domain
MIRHTMVLGALAMTLTAAAYAAPPQPPQQVPEAPAMGGEPQTKPSERVINLTANEVALSRIKGAGLIHTQTERLGDVGGPLYESQRNTPASVPERVGTIRGALFDPGKNAIAFVAVDPIKGGGTVVLPWSDLQPVSQPHDQFVTKLTADDVAKATPFDRATRSSKLIDAGQDLVGRPVTLPNGNKVGTVGDLAIEVQNGHIDYAMIDTNSGIQLGANNAAKAVPWAKIRPVSGDKSQALVVTINQEQLAAAPNFGTSKAQETRGTRDVSKQVGAAPANPR